MEVFQIIVTSLLIVALGFLTFFLVKNGDIGLTPTNNTNTDNVNVTNTNANTNANANANTNVNANANANANANTNGGPPVTVVTGELGGTQRFCFDLTCPPPPKMCCPPCPTCPVCGNSPNNKKNNANKKNCNKVDAPKEEPVTIVSCCRQIQGDCGCMY